MFDCAQCLVFSLEPKQIAQYFSRAFSFPQSPDVFCVRILYSVLFVVKFLLVHVAAGVASIITNIELFCSGSLSMPLFSSHL